MIHLNNDGGRANIEIIVRKVKANSEDEALNKFVNGTCHVQVNCISRHNPECIELSNLKSIE